MTATRIDTIWVIGTVHTCTARLLRYFWMKGSLIRDRMRPLSSGVSIPLSSPWEMVSRSHCSRASARK